MKNCTLKPKRIIANLQTNNLFFPKVNEKENMEREKPITESECFKALSELSNNKSPDLDGFSIEFYKVLWQDLNEIFLKCLNLLSNSKSAL